MKSRSAANTLARTPYIFLAIKLRQAPPFTTPPHELALRAIQSPPHSVAGQIEAEPSCPCDGVSAYRIAEPEEARPIINNQAGRTFIVILHLRSSFAFYAGSAAASTAYLRT